MSMREGVSVRRGGLCPKVGRYLSRGRLYPERGLCMGGLCMGGLCPGGSLCQGEGDRQTPVKTLPSLAVDESECRCSLCYEIHHFCRFIFLREKLEKTTSILKPKYCSCFLSFSFYKVFKKIFKLFLFLGHILSKEPQPVKYKYFL